MAVPLLLYALLVSGLLQVDGFVRRSALVRPKLSFRSRMASFPQRMEPIACLQGNIVAVAIPQDVRVKLATLGFVDEDEIRDALSQSNGDVEQAIKILSTNAANDWNSERRDIDELMEKGGCG
mmetsp:Transcript_2119/g.3058  ORF Transcript_2119/g.3058 Transcript_2119/m.3058 type:complete len:123 (+) Transcript_2119:41-409(+)